MCVCVCVCVRVCSCVCFWVCVLHDNSKRNRSRKTKLEYMVAYENSLDEFASCLNDLLIPREC